METINKLILLLMILFIAFSYASRNKSNRTKLMKKYIAKVSEEKYRNKVNVEQEMVSSETDELMRIMKAE